MCGADTSITTLLTATTRDSCSWKGEDPDWLDSRGILITQLRAYPRTRVGLGDPDVHAGFSDRHFVSRPFSA